MKKIHIFIFSCALFLMSTTTNAAIDTQTTDMKNTPFNMEVLDITRSMKTDNVKFEFKIDKVIRQESISYWKVRSYCDKKMTIQINASSTNDCSKAVRFNSLSSENTFSFLFDNQTNSVKSFSVKLKAYDKNGKWLHTEKENFRWK